MDETQGESRTDPVRRAPAGYVYEFGTWRLVPASSARRSTTQGRPPKKRGG